MIIPVILSGGAGTRLWPASRKGYPKPFLDFDGSGSLLQKTWQRVAQLADSQLPLIITNRDYYFQSREQLKQVSGKADFLLEPVGRNTAPAILAAAHYVNERYGAEAVMLVVAADHLIHDQAAFARSAAAAARLAVQGRLVTFGITPQFAHTGFGYIQAGDAIAGSEGCHQVTSFHEKPDLAKAERMLAEGGYFWNSGMFCCTAGQMLAEFAEHAAHVSDAVRQCWDVSRADNEHWHMFALDQDSFGKCPDISVDYAVVEKSANVAMVGAGFDWSDIGSWDAVAALGEQALPENVINIDSQDCYFQTGKRVVAAIGLENLVVVDTPDALLISRKDRAQDVKKVVDRLKAEGSMLHEVHNTMYRPWGSYTVLEEAAGYKIKRIEVKPGQSLSLQMHHHRSEHWIVVSGMARVVNGDKEFLLGPNESTYIPAGHVHRLSNPGVIDLAIIEVQSGQYLEEDDIVRFEDHYGRQ